MPKANPMTDASRRALDDFRKAVTDDMTEALLENGPRREGVVPTPQHIALCASLAEVCFLAISHRFVPVQVTHEIAPKDTSSDETTADLIERLVKPAMIAKLAEAIRDTALMQVDLEADATLAVFSGIAMGLDMRETTTRETAEDARRRAARAKLILPTSYT